MLGKSCCYLSRKIYKSMNRNSFERKDAQIYSALNKLTEQATRHMQRNLDTSLLPAHYSDDFIQKNNENFMNTPLSSENETLPKSFI